MIACAAQAWQRPHTLINPCAALVSTPAALRAHLAEREGLHGVIEAQVAAERSNHDVVALHAQRARLVQAPERVVRFVEVVRRDALQQARCGARPEV